MPTFGKPTSPTSARSFSSSRIVWLSPGRPGLAKRGTCLVGVAKCWLPQPPHVVHDLAGVRVAQHRAARHLDAQRLAHLAGAALALTGLAVAGHVFALIAKVHQRGHVVVNFKDNVAPAAAVAAVGPARRHVLLAVEGHSAVPAVPGAHGDRDFINKRRGHVWVPPVSFYHCESISSLRRAGRLRPPDKPHRAEKLIAPQGGSLAPAVQTAPSG